MPKSIFSPLASFHIRLLFCHCSGILSTPVSQYKVLQVKAGRTSSPAWSRDPAATDFRRGDSSEDDTGNQARSCLGSRNLEAQNWLLWNKNQKAREDRRRSLTQVVVRRTETSIRSSRGRPKNGSTRTRAPSPAGSAGTAAGVAMHGKVCTLGIRSAGILGAIVRGSRRQTGPASFLNGHSFRYVGTRKDASPSLRNIPPSSWCLSTKTTSTLQLRV